MMIKEHLWQKQILRESIQVVMLLALEVGTANYNYVLNEDINECLAGIEEEIVKLYSKYKFYFSKHQSYSQII